MSSENSDKDPSSKPSSSDLMKKLNDAFSSYLDGDGSTAGPDSISEKESLLELVRSEIAEKQAHMEGNSDEDVVAEDPVTAIEGVIDPENDRPAISEIKDTEAIVDIETSEVLETPVVPDALSGVFDDVQYQSVDIEVTEDEGPTEDEDEGRYSEVISDILKKKPKTTSAPASVTKNEHLSDILSGTEDEPSVEEKVPDPDIKLKGTGNDFVPVEMPAKEDEGTPVMIKPEFRKTLLKDDSSRPVPSFVDNTPKDKPKVSVVKKSEPAEKVEKPDIRRPSSVPSSEPLPEPIQKKDVRSVQTSQEKAEEVVFDTPDIAFLYNKDHTSHDAASLSMNTHEKPERIIKAMWYLEKSKVFEDGTCTLLNDFEMADESDLLRVHDESYISFVRNYASSGGGFLGDSTYMTPTSYDIAKMAAGAAIKAGDLLVDKEYSHAFVLARPPGHHASSQKYGGFCLFNNAAVLARYLQKCRNVRKVLILDWDAHAGDGTMEIFYEDPTVMFLSTHRDPHGFYPRKGFSTQIGENAGKGYTLNVEMPEGSGNEEYMLAFDEAIIPMIRHFSPDFLIVSCGFDAYYKEKNIGLALDSEGYHQLTTKVRSVFDGPMVFLMEGGYHDSNGQLCHSVLNSLHGKPNPVSDRQEMSSYKVTQQKQIFEQTKKKVEESKKHSPVLSSQVSQ
ncbi:histone deacetylase [Methanolobus sp. WCC4]|uniref:histone deacetylase family protein n=1 Tax=Methanolobus sp. WCC4 TaxID=3125784 RepID=UPI0030F6B96A